MDLISPLKTIKGIGPTTVKRFQKLGVENIRDLLFYYPFRYDDFSKITLIENLQAGEPATVSGKITLIANRRAKRRRMVITEALLEDKSDVIKITWFNQAFITQNLNVGDQVYISGKPEYYLNSLQFSNPSYEKIKEQTTHTARLIPIYPSTEKLTQKQIRWIIQAGLESANQIDEWLPQNILTKYNLISLPWAITQIHFPDSKEQLHLAEERLKFDELFLIQLKNFYLRQKLAKQISPAINFFESETKKFVASLGFKLTDAQRKCAWQIIADLEKTIPMNRLLEGDVGSGKTVVAGIALLNVILNQQQAVLLAPTEILAQQHYQTFLNLFQSYNFRIALLTRTNQKLNGQEISKKDLLKALAENQVDLVIGTHALLQEKIKFAKLALAIVDEQHRFGVNQRAQIVEQINQTATPHFLSMTATPIPRSLALTIFGDLDLSIIDEMPSNRKKIITKLVDPKNRYQAYHFIANQIKTGRQVFVVCPLIDPSDKLGVKSVTQEYEKLNDQIFPEIKIGLLHGKLKKDDKQQVVQDFLDQKTKILVSTTVIEVGIDIPNASVMMIEDADRFGLAQLHQLRGRVGRSVHQSYCFVFTDNANQKTLERLRALVNSHNGFELAEKDLEFRGPGQVYGTLQSGYMPELRIAKLSDQDINQKAKQAVELLFKTDPELKNYPELKNRLRQNEQGLHLE